MIATIGVLMNNLLLNLSDLGFGGTNYEEYSSTSVLSKLPPTEDTPTTSKVLIAAEAGVRGAAATSIRNIRYDGDRGGNGGGDDANNLSWCEKVRQARADLSPSLRISYPCDNTNMQAAKSAIVCMLTDGVTETSKASRIVFTARNYLEGAMSLGASLQGKIDPSQTHQLLLLREGFELESDDILRLESVGWVIGTAKNFELESRYMPKFPRYKTTYTKVTAIGLSEYECVMLMDADTLAVRDLKDVMTCSIFRSSTNRVGGTIDWYRSRWQLFNTGSILWKTSTYEMERVRNLTKDPSFMKRFGSDQDFLNNVYPERLNVTLNDEIVALDTPEARGGMPVVPHELAQKGAVLPLSWEYNAQTHAEVQFPTFWEDRRPTVRILHFTEKKGWQCERRYDPPPPMSDMPQPCPKENPICFCREAHLYWKALRQAELAYHNTIMMHHAETIV